MDTIYLFPVESVFGNEHCVRTVQMNNYGKYLLAHWVLLDDVWQINTRGEIRRRNLFGGGGQ